MDHGAWDGYTTGEGIANEAKREIREANRRLDVQRKAIEALTAAVEILNRKVNALEAGK